MKQRCYSEGYKDYKNYGGRGIGICQEWLDSSDAFEAWALANGYAENLTIERIDVNKGYSPENCTWIPAELQLRNRRICRYLTIDGETRTMSEWFRDPRCTVTLTCVCGRLLMGMDPKEAVFGPSKRPRKKQA